MRKGFNKLEQVKIKKTMILESGGVNTFRIEIFEPTKDLLFFVENTNIGML